MKLGVLVALAAMASGAEMRLAPEGRPLKLEVEKAGLLAGKKHEFEFPAYSGTVLFDAANPAASWVRIEVMAGEFRVMDDWISERDRRKVAEFTRSDGMLDAVKHPKLLYRSVGIEPAGEGEYRVGGELTIRGVTQRVDLHVRLRRAEGGLIVEGRGEFPMTQFGLKPPSAALGAIRTRDVMKLRFAVLAR